MEFTPEKFNQIKNDAEDFYSRVGDVYCPYFSSKINFNTKGLDHLIFKSWNRTRSMKMIKKDHKSKNPPFGRFFDGIWLQFNFNRERSELLTNAYP